MHVLGTPAQLVTFCQNWPRPPAYRVCFDLDNTLFGPPKIPGDYSTCPPIPRAVTMCHHLKAMGHHVILHTARRMRTHAANVGAVVADIGAVTLKACADAGAVPARRAFRYDSARRLRARRGGAGATPRPSREH